MVRSFPRPSKIAFQFIYPDSIVVIFVAIFMSELEVGSFFPHNLVENHIVNRKAVAITTKYPDTTCFPV